MTQQLRRDEDDWVDQEARRLVDWLFDWVERNKGVTLTAEDRGFVAYQPYYAIRAGIRAGRHGVRRLKTKPGRLAVNAG